MYEESFNFKLDKHNNPIDENGKIADHFVEVGLIAQDLLKIPREDSKHLTNKPGKKYLEWRYNKYK